MSFKSIQKFYATYQLVTSTNASIIILALNTPIVASNTLPPEIIDLGY